jgi:hypothetical protein
LEDRALSVERLCTDCRSPGPFPTLAALKCTRCRKKIAKGRGEYLRGYDRARKRAIKRLIEMHPRVFRKLMAEERTRGEKK